MRRSQISYIHGVRRLTRVGGPIATLVVLPFVAREVGSRFLYLPAYPEVLAGVAIVTACLTAAVVLSLAAWTQLGGRVWVPTLAAAAILGIAHGTTYVSFAQDSLTIMRATALAMVGAMLGTHVAKRALRAPRLKSTQLHAMTVLVSFGVLAGFAVWAVYCEAHHLGIGVGGGCAHFELRAMPPEWLRSRTCFAHRGGDDQSGSKDPRR